MSFLLPYIFQVLYVLCFTRPRYQVSVYRTIGLLVKVVNNYNCVCIEVTVYDPVHNMETDFV